MLSMDKHMSAASQAIIGHFQDHYPEFLSRKLFINVPYLLEKFYPVISILVPARTRSKFSMVSSGNMVPALLDIIDPCNLPAQYSGFTDANGYPLSTRAEQIYIKAGSKTSIDVTVARNCRFGTVMYLCVFGDINVCGEGVAVDRKQYGVCTFPTNAEGKICVTFDNSFSYWNGKNVYYVVLGKKL